MSNAGALIERFRNQRPTSRAERDYLRTAGQAPPLWWKKENQPDRDRESFDPDAPALRDPKSLYTKTTPIPRTKYDSSLERRNVARPAASSIDDLVFGDIFEHQRTYDRTNYDQEESSPRRSDDYSESIERTETRTNTRFRFAPTLSSSRDLYGMPYKSTLMSSKFRSSSRSGGGGGNDSQMIGRSSLVAVDDESDTNTSNNKSLLVASSSHHSASDIGIMLEDTLAKLNEKLAEGEGISSLPREEYYSSYRNYDDEDLPASISAVREELEANLMCFNLLFESKFKREDDAEEEAKAKAALEREEIVKEVAAEQAMNRLFEPLEEYIDREPMHARQHRRHHSPHGNEYVYHDNGNESRDEIDEVELDREIDLVDHTTEEDDGDYIVEEVAEDNQVRHSMIKYDARFKENECHFVRVSRSSIVPLQVPPSFPSGGSVYPTASRQPQNFSLAATSRGLCNELDEVMGRLNQNFETQEMGENVEEEAEKKEEEALEDVPKMKTRAELEREAALAVFEAALDEEDARQHWRGELSDMRRGWAVYQTQDKEELEALKAFRDSVVKLDPTPHLASNRSYSQMPPSMPHRDSKEMSAEYMSGMRSPPKYPTSIPPGFVHMPPPPTPPSPNPNPEDNYFGHDIPPNRQRLTHKDASEQHKEDVITAAAHDIKDEYGLRETINAKDRLERFKQLKSLYKEENGDARHKAEKDYLLTASPKADPKERLAQLKAQRANVTLDFQGY